MKRTANAFANPFVAWTDLAWKLGEMSLASAQVVAHRTSRMAACGPLPSARDRNEFTRMGQEKLEAATESTQAIAAHLFGMNLDFGAGLFRSMVTGGAAMASLAASQNVGQFVTRHASLAETVLRSSRLMSDFSNSAASLAGRSLKPIHARATANARRLGRR